MSNRMCHKMVSRAMRGTSKEMRKAAHQAAHAYINGISFDNWKVIEADKLLLRKGVDARAFNKDPRNWMEQPD